MTVVGLLHPGAMGAALGAELRRAGWDVRWASEGRSAATKGRAEAAGLHDAATVEALVAGSDVVLSVCPPHAAEDVATTVAATGFAGTFVDGNAVAPGTARRIAELVAPARFVDGGIIGPPPAGPGTTRLHLSGEGAAEVAALFAGTTVEARVHAGGPGAASAVKVCFAAWTKGTPALLLAIRSLAAAEGVEDALLAEWATSQPDLARRSDAAAGTVDKAWRFVGEMEESAAAFAAAGLPGGFSQAAAEVYAALAADREPVPPYGAGMAPSIYPVLRYADADKALSFLAEAFGFREISVHRDDKGTIVHATMAWQDDLFMFSGSKGAGDPFDLGPAVIYVAVDDPDAHHDRAVAAGAELVMELTDQDYGSREYAARDLEGNVWCFGTYRPTAS